MNRLCAIFCLLLPAAPLAAAEPDSFFFKKGDRVVFLGDSITEQYQYSSDIELYLTTRFPKWNLVFVNAGIGGDLGASSQARARIAMQQYGCVFHDALLRLVAHTT